jgi:hypothetical protein
LQALATLLDIELNALSFSQIPDAIASDGGIVDKQVSASIPRNEAKAFVFIEPLDGSFRSLRHFLPFTYVVRRKVQPVGAKKPPRSKNLGGRPFMLEPVLFFVLQPDHSTFAPSRQILVEVWSKQCTTTTSRPAARF